MCIRDSYGSECCDTAWAEYGITCSDLEANYYWDCSGCECPGDLLGSDNSYNPDLYSIEENISPYTKEHLHLSDHFDKIFNPVQHTRDYELIATVESTDYIDTDVINGANYCYYVVAANISGESDPSNIDCAEPYGLNSPSNLVATGEVGSIYLEWTAPPSAGDDGGGTDLSLIHI